MGVRAVTRTFPRPRVWVWGLLSLAVRTMALADATCSVWLSWDMFHSNVSPTCTSPRQDLPAGATAAPPFAAVVEWAQTTRQQQQVQRDLFYDGVEEPAPVGAVQPRDLAPTPVPARTALRKRRVKRARSRADLENTKTGLRKKKEKPHLLFLRNPTDGSGGSAPSPTCDGCAAVRYTLSAFAVELQALRDEVAALKGLRTLPLST